MNRGTALLLAMAALLAHALAIHHDQLQRFAAPYDFAHVAYRLGRNLVHEGSLTWNASGGGGLASYPSPLLVLLSALAERLYLPVTSFCQAIGITASLLAVGLSASFSTNRFAGIIPSLLLVFSGTAAASAGSGSEFPLLTLFVALAYVSFEHRWHARFSLGMGLMAITRVESLVLVAGFLLLAALERLIPRKDGQSAMPLWTFLPAAAGFAVLFGWPATNDGNGGSAYGMLLAPLLQYEPERWMEGLLYLWDFLVGAAIPLLIAYPLLFLTLGRLSGAGARALGLSVLWALVVILQGGGPAPFSLAITPALAPLFIAIQQGILAAIDTHQRFVEKATWAALGLAVSLSALASKYPGNLGPLPVIELHETWMTASAPPEYGGGGKLGRLALEQEVRKTTRLRNLGSFLRRHLDPQTTLWTPWPGAVGYLSRLEINDAFERTTSNASSTELSGHAPWSAPGAADILATLEAQPDYILPGLLGPTATRGGAALERVRREFRILGGADDPLAEQAIGDLLRQYEMVVVPLQGVARSAQRWGTVQLLRKRSLDLAPQIEIDVDDSWIQVAVMPREPAAVDRTLPQTAWLQLSLLDSAGTEWWLSPAGVLRDSADTFARCGIVVNPSERRIDLCRFDLELIEKTLGRPVAEARAVLLNPWGVASGDAYARASEETRRVLR